jgi:hypothetical protein
LGYAHCFNIIFSGCVKIVGPLCSSSGYLGLDGRREREYRKRKRRKREYRKKKIED